LGTALVCEGAVRVDRTYQCAGDVDAAVADGGVIEPFWLGEAEEAVV